MARLNPRIEGWFKEKGWQIRAHQRAMLRAYAIRQSTLLIAPTGAGKTLSGFLPSINDLARREVKGMHTLYISPLKALTQDIARNLEQPVAEMQLPIRIETRTGDTPSHKRQRQRKNPPHILLTTPESLMLMLSYADSDTLFANLSCVIIDEVHSMIGTKRGDFTALALSRLRSIAPQHIRFGLSATVADPPLLANWLGEAEVKVVKDNTPPQVRIMETQNRIPFGGFMARYAISEIYQHIKAAKTALVFVNTRAQSEFIFQMLWEANEDGLPIALYHGSLSKEQRRKTESLMAAGKLRAVVATAALELGIDWGDVDLVVQIGAPKGVSRLLQRIGRSNHRMDEPSRALLVPSNRFEVLECAAAMRAIGLGELDNEEPPPGAADIIPQYIINCACSGPVDPATLYREVQRAQPYQQLTKEQFDELFRFAMDGGYALKSYERYQRLLRNEDGLYEIPSRRVVQRHRQNIGTIVEAPRLKVKRLGRGKTGRIVGEVEENFALGLTPGDSFMFAGEVLLFEGVRDLVLEARPAPAMTEPKIPSYVGGQMPLSTYLAEGVRELLNQPGRWGELPDEVREWLELQQQYSALPGRDALLVEHFPRHKWFYTLYYTFDGRRANQTLGMLITQRMERAKLHPLSFSVTDYGLSIANLVPLNADHIAALFNPDLLGDDLEEWLMDSPMLRRAFRQVATISGLTEQRYGGEQKTARQMTFSTDLIYNVLRRHEPGHVLLNATRQDAERQLLDLPRLSALLNRYHERIEFHSLKRASPLSIPILLDVKSELIHGAGAQILLSQQFVQDEAESLMEAVRHDIAGN